MKNPKRPGGPPTIPPAAPPDEALQRQLDEIKRREHEKHLTKYRQHGQNGPYGS